MLHVGAGKRTLRIFGSTGGGIGFPSFNLPLNDLGNGIVNTVPAQSAGSPVATFTRASVAWAKMASGLWGQVATGVARSHYLGRDTGVGPYGGYWPELASVQLVPTTRAIRDMTDPSWVAVGITPTLTATGIDGAANACTTLTCTAPNGTILQTLVAAASSRTNSAFVRRRTGGGAILLKQGTATLDITASLSSVIFTRPQLNDNELNVTYGFQMATIGDQIDVDFNQFESLAATQFATSPMASAGAARSTDLLQYLNAGNINSSTGVCYAELSSNWTTCINFVAVGVGSDSAVLWGQNFASTSITVFDGANSVTKNGLSDLSTGVRKRVVSWGAGGLNITGDGAAVATGAFDGSMVGAGNIQIGAFSNGSQWNGTIRNVRIYPTQLTNAQLLALTA
jgi:hypothetical protein